MQIIQSLNQLSSALKCGNTEAVSQRSLSVGDDALYEGMRARRGREPGDGFSKLRPMTNGCRRLLPSRIPLIPAGLLELAATTNSEKRASFHLSGGSCFGRTVRITGSCVTFAPTAECSCSHKCLIPLPFAGKC